MVQTQKTILPKQAKGTSSIYAKLYLHLLYAHLPTAITFQFLPFQVIQ